MASPVVTNVNVNESSSNTDALLQRSLIDSLSGKENLPTKMSSSRSGKHTSSLTQTPQFNILTDDQIAAGILTSNGNGSHIKPNKKRRSLSVLQPSSDQKRDLAGAGRSNAIKDAFQKTRMQLTFSEKRETNKSSRIIVEEESPDEKDLVKDALYLLKETENASDSYWKSQADELRSALEETLAENEELYNTVDRLSIENDNLRKQLEEAKYYKLLYLSQQENVDSLPQATGVADTDGTADT